MTRAEVHLKVSQRCLLGTQKPESSQDPPYHVVPLICIAHARPELPSDNRRRLDKAVLCVTVKTAMHPDYRGSIPYSLRRAHPEDTKKLPCCSPAQHESSLTVAPRDGATQAPYQLDPIDCLLRNDSSLDRGEGPPRMTSQIPKVLN
jgi:hypothetical protein